MLSNTVILCTPIFRRHLSSLRSTRIPGPRTVPIKSGRLRATRANVGPEISSDAQRAENQYESDSGVENSLLTPVHIPEDKDSVLHSRHPATRILENSALVVQRQLELGNLLLGFEQANKYVIMDPHGNHVGFMAEEESGIGRIIARQWFRTHRAFTTHVFDKYENEVLRFHRPFSWINSRIRVYDPIDPRSFPSASPGDDRLVYFSDPNQYRIIGEAQQQWHLWRRKYNLFLYNDPPEAARDKSNEPAVGGREGYFTQFAYIDEPFLSWDFSLLAEKNQLIGSVNRNFSGFGRELFTDTGVYCLRMDAASIAAEPRHLISKTAEGKEYRTLSSATPVQSQPAGKGHKDVVGDVAAGRGMTLDERAVMLAAAVSVDFDYFSRHSGHGGFLPIGVYGGEYRDSTAENSMAGGVAGGMAGGMMGGAMGGAMGGMHPPGTTESVPPVEQGQQAPPQSGEDQMGEQEGSGWPYQESPWGRDMDTQGQGGPGPGKQQDDGNWWFFDDEE